MAPNASSDVVASSSSSLAFTQQLPHLQIVDRLVAVTTSQFPLVNTAIDYTAARYSALKASSQLLGSTLGRAEKSFDYVVTTAVVPVLNQLEQPIHYADNKAVQGLDLVQAKLGSSQKSLGELKDTAAKVLDQTKERIAAVKTQTLSTVQSKVHSVLTMPSNLVPLVDQVLAAGENVLDYLLPDGKDGSGSQQDKQAQAQQNGSAKVAPEEVQDTRALIRLIIVRMRVFTDKVQRRVSDYSRDRWLPALFSKVVVIKGNLAQLLANGAAAGNKLLANGHSNSTNSPAPAEEQASTSAPASASTTNTSTTSNPNQGKSGKKNQNTSSKATSTSASSNGDLKTQQQEPAQAQS